MEDKQSNSILKFVLDFGPVIIFFLAYKYAPLGEVSENERDLEKIIFATKIFVPVIFISLWFKFISSANFLATFASLL